MKNNKLELVDETGLNEAQRTQASILHKKYPHIVKIHTELRQGEQKLKNKWFSFCEALRSPEVGVQMNSREMSLFLRSLGESYSRASEIIRVVSVDDDTWNKYKTNVIGFKATLRIARKGLDQGEVPAGGEGDEGETAASAQTEPAVTKTDTDNHLPDSCVAYATSLYNQMITEKIALGKYVHGYAAITGNDALVFEVTIKVSKKSKTAI